MYNNVRIQNYYYLRDVAGVHTKPINSTYKHITKVPIRKPYTYIEYKSCIIPKYDLL